LLPSSDDSGKNFSRSPCRTSAEVMITQAILCLWLFNYAHLSPHTNSFLLKPKVCVSIPKMGWSELHCLFYQVPMLLKKLPFPALHRYLSFYLTRTDGLISNITWPFCLKKILTSFYTLDLEYFPKFFCVEDLVPSSWHC
jgi:hypothetical protein